MPILGYERIRFEHDHDGHTAITPKTDITDGRLHITAVFYMFEPTCAGVQQI